jgi:hypothetical protein
MKRETWAVLGLILIYLLGGVIEPCDGKSCQGVESGN